MEFRTLANRLAEVLGAEPPVIGAVEAPRAAAQGGPADAPGRTVDGPGAARAMPPIDREAYVTIRDAETLAAWMAEATEGGLLCVDLETTSLDEMVAQIVGVALATAPGKAAYVPIAHTSGDGDLLGRVERVPDQLNLDNVLDALKPVLADPATLKIGQNLKYDLKVLKRHGVEVTPIDDTMLMSYALDSGVSSHGMDVLSERHLGHRTVHIKDLIGSGKTAITFDKVDLDKAATYAAEDADITFRLWGVLRPRLAAERVSTVYHTLERPLIPVLVDMELAGIKVHRDTLSRLSNSFAQSMAGLEAEIEKLVGHPFNIGSPKQLGEILFDEMSLMGGKKGKTGAYATGADVLEGLAAEGHDLPGDVRFVHLPDMRDVDPARMQPRARYALNPPERLDLDRAELCEIDLWHLWQGRAGGALLRARQRAFDPGFDIGLRDAALGAGALDLDQIGAQLAREPAHRRRGMSARETRLVDRRTATFGAGDPQCFVRAGSFGRRGRSSRGRRPGFRSRFGRRGTRLASGIGGRHSEQAIALRNAIAFLHEELEHFTRAGRGNVHRGLLGLERDQRCLGLELIAGCNQHLDDLDIREIAKIRHAHFDGFGCLRA
jgi:hypothetical protein